MSYADAIRSALLTLHERTIDDPRAVAFFGGPVLVRELTAGQRLRATAAARYDNPDEPDVALYNAMVVQLCVVDPASGDPYADGRRDDAGAPLIDPRTRKPVFAPDDLPALIEARDAPIGLLLDAIFDLGALLPRHTFRSDPTPDGAE